ncbi:hypothetical protein OHA71_06490 [Streptomyces sp. NBC_00444]|uniref:SPOR domain-containing protein n=1 Tax=Streptomyces sp. NBC_00444 TaxID=2975744 RepID=UPI002E24128F
MNQQYPQQPGWGQQPQHPQQQAGWSGPQQPGWGAPPPQPPKKPSTGKILGFGCAGVVALFVVIGIFAAALGGGSDDSSKGSTVSSEPTATDDGTPAEKGESAEAKPSDKPKADEPKKAAKPKVVFKVWGTAPAGALGSLDITYGSDSDNRKGTFKDGKFEATLPLDDDAMYYTVMAQLQGSGDINCSVTIDGETKKAHASGDYNICHAQASKGLLGGWD